jgi:hypothetical protein
VVVGGRRWAAGNDGREHPKKGSRGGLLGNLCWRWCGLVIVWEGDTAS